MYGGRARRGSDEPLTKRLTSLSSPIWDLPSDFRGTAFHGEEAARRASAVSGPFRASPPAFLIPEDRESLGLLVARAFERGRPLIPRGAGTGMPGGNLGPHAVVEVASGFEEVEWLDAAAGRIRVGAGAVAAEVDRVAHERGRFLPFLPSSSRWCRFGGMLANNAAGARSFRYGAIADWVEVVEGVSSSGERFRAGPAELGSEPYDSLRHMLAEMLAPGDGHHIDGWPRVRKNASGYALDRFLASGNPAQLWVGSEGTLGVITDVELRLPPAPDARGLVVLPAHSSKALVHLSLEAERLGTTTCEFLGRRFLEIAGLQTDEDIGALARRAEALLLVEVSGSRDEVGHGIKAVTELGRQVSGPGVAARSPEAVERLWSIRHAASPVIAREAGRGRISTQFIEDSVVPPARLGDYLEGLTALLEEVEFDAVVFGHAGDANVHVNPLLDVGSPDVRMRARRLLEGVTDLVRSLGGTLSGEHGDGRLRTPLLQRIWPPELIRAFGIVKESLDPRGILNPGVIRPLPDQDPFDGFAPRPRSHPR